MDDIKKISVKFPGSNSVHEIERKILINMIRYNQNVDISLSVGPKPDALIFFGNYSSHIFNMELVEFLRKKNQMVYDFSFNGPNFK